MSSSPGPSGNTTVTDAKSAPVILLLDHKGKISAANGAAYLLWQATGTELTGEPFPSLFEFEVVSSEADWLEMQWDVLQNAAASTPLKLRALRKEGDPVDTWVQIEKITREPATFIATIASSVQVASIANAVAAPAPAGDPGAAQILADQSTLGFFDLNFRDKRFSYAPAWKKMLGYGPSELPDTLETWTGLLHPEDSSANPAQSPRKMFNGRKSFSLEFRMRHKNGDFRWVQSEGLQLFSADGTLDRVVGTNIDIHDRKELESTALSAEDRMSELYRCEGLALFDLDFSSGEFWHSSGFDRLFGYEGDELGNSIADFQSFLTGDDESATPREFWLGKIPEQNAFSGLRLCSKTMDTLELSGSFVSHVSRRGELLRVTGFFAKDSTGPKRRESNSHNTEHFLRALSSIHECVVIVDQRGIALFLNEKAERFLGQRLDGRELRAAEIVRIVRRHDGKQTEQPIDKILANGEPIGMTEQFGVLDADQKSFRPIVFSGVPLKNENGGIAGCVLIFRNPEEMSLTPEEVIRANRFESLGVLAGGIAHDFNNLLSTILGGISIARDNRDFAALEDSEKACMTAKSLTKELLAFTKGGTNIRQVVNVADVLRDSIRIAGAGSAAIVQAFVAEGTSTIAVHRSQMLQVFQNLVVNALQAMPAAPHRPEVTLHARNQNLDEGQLRPLPAGKYVRIDVRDNGSGISEENLQKIFNPFFTTKKTGSGIGLATVLSIVRDHSGQIGVESIVGKGTTFSIFLPQAELPVEIEPRRAPSLRFGNGRVLLMDDDEKICMFTARMLESLEYKYDIAKNGEEAIALYRRYLKIGRPYDAVILDLTIIGGMGGEETYTALKNLDAEVRAIVSSGYDNDEIAREFLAKGFCAYLTKPYRVADLGKTLKGVLG